MPFATAKEHRDFYLTEQYIVFEGLLKESDVEKAYQAMRKRPPGRDYWRNLPAIRKIALRRDFAQIVAELTQMHYIRLAFDESLGRIPSAQVSLSEISGVQGLIAGAILCLQPTDSASTFFPKNAGDAVFFSADFIIPFDELQKTENYLLIAYAKKEAVYTHNFEDPYLYHWKKLEYTYGDRLKDMTHPLLYP